MGPFIVVVALALISGSCAQRVAPGVPPQHYQQQQPQHGQQVHYQQQQQQPQFQQQQQVPPGVHPGQYQPPPPPQQQQQFQQVPQGQQQFQQPPPPQHQQQQVLVQGGHHQPHQQGHHAPQGFNPGHIDDHERQHIQEHAEVPIDTSKMSEQELQFHYFKMHDADHNNKLDGCELIKSLIHYHADTGKSNDHKVHIYEDKDLAGFVDMALGQLDENKDGYITYAEYRKSELARNTADDRKANTRK